MAPRTRSLALLAAVLAAPLALRAGLLVRDGITPGLIDLRGLTGDLAVGLAAAAGLGLLMRWSRIAVGSVLGVWTLLCYANYEHVVALDANAALAYAAYLADPTFLGGSAAVSAPLGMLALFAAVAVLGALALRGGRSNLARGSVAAAALGLFALQWLWPEDPAALRWRQHNVLIENARGLAPRPDRGVPSARGPRPPVPSEPRGGLAGEPRIALDQTGRNVLLLVVEGVSGAHLRSVASAQGRGTSYDMPNLSQVAREGLTWTNFVALQRQTNRGMYALLCGDLPLLSTGPPRMSEYAAYGGSDCLPSVLADAGYETVFLQAAPLAFMMKDQFMPRAGFARSIGVEYFDRAYSRSRWGVDDLAFLERSVDMIRDLQARGGPWFLTLLTSGTHHPFNVPQDFVGGGEPGSHAHAAHYLDRAVGRFLELIQQAGVLRDSLVLITSDESAGLRDGDDPTRGLAQSWGVAIALTPEGTLAMVDEPYSQLDVPVSILDYLGLRERAGEFRGRSLFRSDPSPRDIAFANTYLRTVGGVSAADRFYLCDEDLVQCTSWPVDRSRLFAAPGARDDRVRADEIGFLREAVAESRAPLAAAPSGEFVLMRPGRVRLAPDSRSLQWIFGGQNFAVPRETRLEVEVELALHGAPGRASLIHDFASEGTRFLVRRLPLETGDRMRIAYSFSTNEALRTAVVRLWTDPGVRPTPGLELEVVEARVRLVPDPAPPGGHPGEVEIRRFDLRRPGTSGP